MVSPRAEYLRHEIHSLRHSFRPPRVEVLAGVAPVWGVRDGRRKLLANMHSSIAILVEGIDAVPPRLGQFPRRDAAAKPLMHSCAAPRAVSRQIGGRNLEEACRHTLESVQREGGGGQSDQAGQLLSPPVRLALLTSQGLVGDGDLGPRHPCVVVGEDASGRHLDYDLDGLAPGPRSSGIGWAG